MSASDVHGDPDDREPLEGLFGTNFDLADQVASRITPDEIEARLRHTIQEAGHHTAATDRPTTGKQSPIELTSNDETSNYGEVTDQELNLLLTATNQEPPEHIQAAADPDRTLTSITAMDTPASGHEASPALAALVISMRSKAHNLDRALDQTLARALDRTAASIHAIARALPRSSDRPRGRLARGLAKARDRALDSASDLALTFARDSARELATALDRHLAVARELATALDSTAVLERTAVLDLARDLIFVLDRASDSARALDRDLARDLARARALDRDLNRDITRASDLARDLNRDLQAQRVDASGADLSDLEIGNVDVLDGVIWTHETLWPSVAIKGQVEAQSEEVHPGVYQVRVGRAPDHSSLTRV